MLRIVFLLCSHFNLNQLVIEIQIYKDCFSLETTFLIKVRLNYIKKLALRVYEIQSLQAIVFWSKK